MPRAGAPTATTDDCVCLCLRVCVHVPECASVVSVWMYIHLGQPTTVLFLAAATTQPSPSDAALRPTAAACVSLFEPLPLLLYGTEREHRRAGDYYRIPGSCRIRHHHQNGRKQTKASSAGAGVAAIALPL